MADTTSTHTINTNLDELAEKWKRNNELADAHLATVKAINKEYGKYTKIPPGYGADAPQGAKSPFTPTGGRRPLGLAPGSQTSTERTLDAFYKRTTIKYQQTDFPKYAKDFHAFTSTLLNVAGGGGGASGFLRLLGMAGPAGGAAGIGAAGIGASISSAQSFRERQAEALAYGLSDREKAAFANITKLYTGGEGGTSALFGEVLKQKTTLGGPQIKTGFLKELGVKGATGKDDLQTQAENMLRAYQYMPKNVDPTMWTTVAGKYGITPDVLAINRMKSGKVTAPELETQLTKEREQGKTWLSPEDKKTKADIDEQTETLKQNFSKAWDWLTSKFTDKPVQQLEKEWNELFKSGLHKTPEEMEGYKFKIPLNLDKAWEGIKNFFDFGAKAGNIVAPGAKEQAFEIPGMGKFAFPGSEKVPQNIQDIRDAIVNDKDVTSKLTGGLGAGSAEVGSGGTGLFPTYWSGGMGTAGQPRSLTRGGARGTDAGDIGGTAVTTPGEMGKYRPVYKLGDKDLSDAVVNTIAGEAKAGNIAGTDAVINNMMNRLGTKTYGPSGNLEEVARVPGQYTGYRKAGAEEAAKIRERIRAIASGSLPDITGGSNEYRASWYTGPWRQNHPEGMNIGGNVFARNPKGGTSPYAAFTGGGGGAPGATGGADLAGIYKQPSDVIDHLSEMRDKGFITNEQCVSLATAAVGIRLGSGKEGANVHDWRRGESAEAGNLVGGTPISTFLDRRGKTSNLYAGGGSGTMGAGLDHAATFLNYIYKEGKRVGMNVEEQYSGSGGMHSRAYMFGGSFGERNASNYSAIDVASGGHLGGAANPLTNRDAIARADVNRDKREARMPSHPSSTGAGKYAPSFSMNDVNTFQQQPQFNLHVRNETGANIHRGIAQLGLSNGSFNT